MTVCIYYRNNQLQPVTYRNPGSIGMKQNEIYEGFEESFDEGFAGDRPLTLCMIFEPGDGCEPTSFNVNSGALHVASSLLNDAIRLDEAEDIRERALDTLLDNALRIARTSPEILDAHIYVAADLMQLRDFKLSGDVLLDWLEGSDIVIQRTDTGNFPLTSISLRNRP